MFSSLKKLSFGLVVSVALGWSFAFAIGTGPVVFHHIYGGGGNTGAPAAPYDSDFIVLRNISTSPVSVANWVVQNVGAASSFPQSNRNIILSGVIAPGAYYLVEVETNNISGIPLSNHRIPNLIVGSAFFDPPTSQGFGVQNNKYRLLNSGGSIIDFLGIGSATESLVSGAIITGGATATNFTQNNRSHIRQGLSGSNSTDYAVQNASAIPGCVGFTNVCLLYINTYTVQFLDYNGSIINIQGVNHGSGATAPSNPSRTGYTFSGWNADFSNVTGDLTVTADYTINAYTITFEDRDNSFISSGSVTYGSGATAPSDPSRTGYTFSGWNQDFSLVTGAMTIAAEYNINQYLVTFVDRNSTVLSTGMVNHGSGATAPSNPGRTGYTFSGWNMNFSNITGVTVVTGEYNINQYTITFDTDGGTPVGPITQDFDTAVTSPSNPTKTGYTFSGWVPAVPTTIPAMNTIVTGQWTINSYTLSYTGGGADGGSAPANQTGDYNSTITLAMNTYTRAGYSFSGWDCGSEGGSYTLTGDVICTAKWNINSYIVTFQDYNATFISSGLVTYGSGATAPSNPSRTGYTFSGWNNDFSNVTGDITITAEYMINSYSITFNTDGGTPIMAITGDYNSVIIVPSNPIKTGYIFSGWLPVLPTNMLAINTIVVAQWTLIPVVIPPSVPAPGGYAGGGAGGYFTKDNCPDGDYSSSYYDSQCGTTPTTGEESILDDTISSSLCTQADYKLSSFQTLKKTTEKRQFIVCRLYANGQTIFDTVLEFDYDRIVTREEASRMITKFVQEVLKKDRIRTSNDPLCQFRDLKFANPGLKAYIIDSCQYGIFNGTYDNNFLPRQQFNQAHAIATVLRASYGYQDESGSVRFTPYVDMISTKNLTRKTFTRPSDLKVLESRDMTRGNLGELMYRVAIDLL